ncbi:S-adenosyl-L-methionine-dependent methyltransferase [Daldinia sp. FL1419]|nr:S-adenosyl-L-methionine-dependent methyltransferase [Daldinia sp. FL1419]
MTTLGEWTAIRMFMEWKLFDKIPEDNSVSYQELPSKFKLEPKKPLFLVSPSPGNVTHSHLPPLFKSGDRNGSWFTVLYDDYQPGCSGFPIFFAKSDGRLNPLELLAQQGPEHIEQFGHVMQAMPNYAWPLTGVVMVTHYCANLVEFPGIPPRRCAVQDRAEIIPNIQKEHETNVIMKDPVQRALVYLMRRCLHDYDDEEVINILKILADSLSDDEPRAIVLINDQIMADPPHRFVTGMDMVLMITYGFPPAIGAAVGRISNRAGLTMVKVRKVEGVKISVVECKKTSLSALN